METDALVQDAVLWTDAGEDRYGREKISAAVDIKVRWEVDEQNEITDDGEVERRNVTVFVDREIAEGSLMRLGTIATLPNPVTNVFEVVTYREIPDIKGCEFQRTVTLQKYDKTLPTPV